jgi:hypothetical protein
MSCTLSVCNNRDKYVNTWRILYNIVVIFNKENIYIDHKLMILLLLHSALEKRLLYLMANQNTGAIVPAFIFEIMLTQWHLYF